MPSTALTKINPNNSVSLRQQLQQEHEAQQTAVEAIRREIRI